MAASGLVPVSGHLPFDYKVNRLHVTFGPGSTGMAQVMLTVSASPTSADYNPAAWNRIAQVLRDAGLRAPDQVPDGRDCYVTGRRSSIGRPWTKWRRKRPD